jgi:hypothetical protein
MSFATFYASKTKTRSCWRKSPQPAVPHIAVDKPRGLSDGASQQGQKVVSALTDDRVSGILISIRYVIGYQMLVQRYGERCLVSA